jgi:hypothetical protein
LRAVAVAVAVVVADTGQEQDIPTAAAEAEGEQDITLVMVVAEAAVTEALQETLVAADLLAVAAAEVITILVHVLVVQGGVGEA